MPRKEPSSQQRGSRNEFLRRFGDSHDPIPAALAAAVKQSRLAGRIAQISRPRACRIRNRLLRGTPNALRWRQYKSVMEA
jgi:hypothetical protein